MTAHRGKGKREPSLKVGDKVRCVYGCNGGEPTLVTMVHYAEEFETYFYGINGEHADLEGMGHCRTDLRKVRR